MPNWLIDIIAPIFFIGIFVVIWIWARIGNDRFHDG